MNWKAKARIQNLCGRLPVVGEAAYYALQKSFGDLLRKPDPLDMMTESGRLCGMLQKAGVKIEGARVFEVGSGRRLDMPVGFYLAGAASVITCDLHRYQKGELVMAALERMRETETDVRAAFASVTSAAEFDRRWKALMSAKNLQDVVKVAHIDYRAPADASKTGLPASSIDIHTSYTVFEHIPPAVLEAILREAGRLLTPGGVAFHHIDLSDHFSHADASITPINFLQFSGAEWDKYAGNRFAYHNRLRPKGYEAVYRAAGHRVLDWIPRVETRSLEALKSGFPLAREFQTETREDLCTTLLQVLSRPA